jgi:deazaflavin-dependent oxidoreductase (nitroreductase family)
MAEFNEAAMKQFNENLIKEFRANGGKAVSGPFVAAPLMLLTTTGAKSGKPFTTPLVYTKDGARMVIIASKGGFPTHPAWFHNLKANPTVTVEVGTQKYQAKATITKDPERQRLFDAQAKLMPTFNDYQKATTRQIPVIVLEPA